MSKCQLEKWLSYWIWYQRKHFVKAMIEEKERAYISKSIMQDQLSWPIKYSLMILKSVKNIRIN